MEYLTIRQVMELLQVTRQTVYTYMYERGLPYRRVSPRRFVYPRAELYKWIELSHVENEGQVNAK